MSGGVDPFGFGTHGRLLQQLALVAHAPPAATQAGGEQRGTPTLSKRHVDSVQMPPMHSKPAAQSAAVVQFPPVAIGWLQLPLQQSHDAVHICVGILQTSPSGLQPVGFEQTPTVDIMFGLRHVTLPAPNPGVPGPPQQSPSFWQRSPTRWHPLAG